MSEAAIGTGPTRPGRLLPRSGEGRRGQSGTGMNGVLKGRGRGRDRGHLRGENFRRKVSDVGRDLPSGQELCHFVAEGVTVVFEEVVGLASVHCEKGLENRYESQQVSEITQTRYGMVSAAGSEHRVPSSLTLGKDHLTHLSGPLKPGL